MSHRERGRGPEETSIESLSLVWSSQWGSLCYKDQDEGIGCIIKVSLWLLRFVPQHCSFSLCCCLVHLKLLLCPVVCISKKLTSTMTTGGKIILNVKRKSLVCSFIEQVMEEQAIKLTFNSSV